MKSKKPKFDMTQRPLTSEEIEGMKPQQMEKVFKRMKKEFGESFRLLAKEK